jgi:hypothetical protein
MNIKNYQTAIYRELINNGLEEERADNISFLLSINLDKNGQLENLYETLNLIKQGKIPQQLPL